MDSDLLNILLICGLMGAGVAVSVVVLVAYVAITELLETYFLED